MTEEFFAARQAAAVLKHGILGRYLPVFAAKTGSTAGEVCYLDGFAGPGIYDDGSEGSPALAIRTAKAVAGMKGRASIRGHLIEKDRSAVEQLRHLLADNDVDWEVHHGLAQVHVPRVLDGLQPKTPLFAFIDPFGLLIPLDQVADMLARSGSQFGNRITGAPTELFLNFSVPGINRVGGQLTGVGTDSRWLKARETMVVNVDAALGGAWWHSIWESSGPDRVEQIRSGYVQKLLDAGGSGWYAFSIPAADRWQGPASYHLLFLTRHHDGVWLFHEAVSLAMEEYRLFCHQAEGRLDLEPLATREEQWVDEIAENIERLLDDHGAFRPVDKIADVYGSTFGSAREKHVRAALKRLHKAGATPTDCKGQAIPHLRIAAPRP